MLYAAECEDYEDIYVCITKRQAIKRLIEHGAPNNLLDQSNSNNVDTVDIIDSGEEYPPLRRASRIRDRIKALAKTVTSNNNDRENTGDIKERTKNVDNLSFIPEYVHKTSHKMDWRSF
jgi:hypothetical protein